MIDGEIKSTELYKYPGLVLPNDKERYISGNIQIVK
jgi:hypothetical protein